MDYLIPYKPLPLMAKTINLHWEHIAAKLNGDISDHKSVMRGIR